MAKINEDAVAAGSVTPPDATWQGQPADTDNVANGAARIKETRSALAQTFSQEHYITADGVGRSTGIGHHVEGSARVYVKRETTFGEGVVVDESVGRVRYTPDERKLEVSTPAGWSAVGGAFPGLISYSAVVPDPATDGWALCDGRLITKDDPLLSPPELYNVLIDRLTGGAASSTYLPNLTAGAGSFIRSTPADGSRDPSFTETTEAAIYSHQDHALQNHYHRNDHAHGVAQVNGYSAATAGRTGVATYVNGTPSFALETGNWEASEGTGASFLTSSGVLTMRHPSDTKQDVGSLGSAGDVADDVNVTVDLSHFHQVPEYRGFTKDLAASLSAVGDDAYDIPANENAFNQADETRPMNVAFYPVIKL